MSWRRSVAASALLNLDKCVREYLQMVGELDHSSKFPGDLGQALVSFRAIGKESLKVALIKHQTVQLLELIETE